MGLGTTGSCLACGDVAHFQCDYRDRSDVACATRWCHTHVAKLGTHHYCRRHKPIKLALGISDAPAVRDRTPNLVVNLVDDVSHRLREAALNVRAVPVLLAEVVFPDGATGWEAGWLVRIDGEQVKVVIAVTNEAPTHVDLRVDDGRVSIGVPPWIGRSSSTGATRNSELEEMFRSRLTESVLLAFQIATLRLL